MSKRAKQPSVRLWLKEWHLKKHYGISLQDYQRVYEKQEGKCVICGKAYGSLVVDHDHQTGKMRGLLCRGCNRLLGDIETRPEILERARAYKDSYSIQQL